VPVNVCLQTVAAGNVSEIIFIFPVPVNGYPKCLWTYIKATEGHRMVNYNI